MVVSSPVISSWATVWWYSLNSLSYVYISSHCPTAAAACLDGMSFGRSRSPSFPTPIPMAPEETSISSCPAFLMSLMILHSCSTRRMFRWPVGCARVDVPILITMRICILSPNFWAIISL